MLQLDDQGLVNTDPRFIAQPTFFVNNIPTDIQGATLNRTPQQVCPQDGEGYQLTYTCQSTPGPWDVRG